MLVEIFRGSKRRGKVMEARSGGGFERGPPIVRDRYFTATESVMRFN